MDLPTTGKSELLGFNYRLVGFLYLDHPLGGNMKMQVTFFEQQKSPNQRWLFCFSDVTKHQMRVFKRQLKQKLGTIVGSEEVIPYVQRSIDGADYETFKKVVNEGFDAPARWWNNG